jgi:DNA-binding CsgD family transcriptional regulator
MQQIADKTADKRLPEEYFDLVKIWQTTPYGQVVINYGSYFKDHPSIVALMDHSPCVTSILDLRRQQFDFISSTVKEILGYDSCHFMKKGLAFYNEVMHPEDLHKTWKLIKNIWDFILTKSPADQGQFKFNFDFRIIKPDGKEVRVLAQHSVLQSDSHGTITHVLGVYSDISHLKKSDHQVATTVSTATKNNRSFFTQDECASYKPMTSLSKRELEIVKLLAEGYSSKLIADRLFISFHTVNTHRQNIMEKTSARNTGGVIQFASAHGLI